MAQTYVKGKPVEMPKRVYSIMGFEVPEYDPVTYDWMVMIYWNFDKETGIPCKSHKGAVYALENKISLRPDLMDRIEIQHGTMKRVVWQNDWSDAKRLLTWANEREASEWRVS